MVWYDRLRIYEVDISDPNGELEFFLCASIQFPFLVVVMQFIEDHLSVVGWVLTPVTLINRKGRCDFKMNQYVAWVFESSSQSVGVSIPICISTLGLHRSGINTFLFLGRLVL